MATKPKSRVATKTSALITMHEVNNHTGDHRIVTIVDGKTTAGEWARNNQIATLNNLRACTDQYAGLFPVGVFKVQAVETVSL